MAMGQQHAEVDVVIVHATAKALLVEHMSGGQSKQTWVPISLIDDWAPPGKLGDAESIFVPSWFAEKEGMA